jgi:hypothetical protein
VHRAVTAWFLLLAASGIYGIIGAAHKLGLAPSGLYAAQLADLASRFFTMLFFATAAWLTLVRSQPLAKARGLAPRITALLAVTLLFFLRSVGVVALCIGIVLANLSGLGVLRRVRRV